MDHRHITELAGGAFLLAGTVLAAGFTLAAQITTATGRRGLEPHCPVCGTRNTRESSQRTLRDHLFSLFACAPFRCRRCATRFYWNSGRRRLGTESL